MQYVLGFVLQTVTSPFVSLTLYRTTAPFVCGQVPKRISGDNQLSVSGQWRNTNKALTLTTGLASSVLHSELDTWWKGCCSVCAGWLSEYNCCRKRVITHTSIAAVMARAFSRVCLSVCPRFNRKAAWAINNKLGIRIYSSRSACICPEVKRSRSHGYENRHGRMVAGDACCNRLC